MTPLRHRSVLPAGSDRPTLPKLHLTKVPPVADCASVGHE